jgi:hypothetical protein
LEAESGSNYKGNEDRNVKQLLIENRNMEREMTLKKNRIHQTLRNL